MGSSTWYKLCLYVTSLCSIRTRFADTKFICVSGFHSSHSNISPSIYTFIPLAREMRIRHCTKYQSMFRSPNVLLSPPSAPWVSLGTSICKLASLPAAWDQGFCMASWDLLMSGTASALDLFHTLLMMTLKEWKEAASASLVGHWHTGELKFVFQHQMSAAKALLSVLSLAMLQGRGGLEGWVEAEASMPWARVPPSTDAWCMWDNILVCKCKGYCKSRLEGFVCDAFHKECSYCLRNWVKLTCSRVAFIFACKGLYPLCHRYSISILSNCLQFNI